MRLAIVAAVIWAASAGAGLAQAGGAGGMTLEEVASVFSSTGFPAEVGDGVIYSATNGVNFALYAYNCGPEARCKEFLFSAAFETPSKPGLSTINQFNSGTLAGRAYLDGEGNPNLEHLFTVKNGEDSELVERNLAIWDSVILEFAKAIGYFGEATS